MVMPPNTVVCPFGSVTVVALMVVADPGTRVKVESPIINVPEFSVMVYGRPFNVTVASCWT